MSKQRERFKANQRRVEHQQRQTERMKLLAKVNAIPERVAMDALVKFDYRVDAALRYAAGQMTDLEKLEWQAKQRRKARARR